MSGESGGASSVKASMTIGSLDRPEGEILPTSPMVLSGWALDPAGIAGVEVLLDGYSARWLRYGVARLDVSAAHPGYPDSERAGFEGELILATAGLSLGRHLVAVEVVNKAGQRKRIAQKTVLVGVGAPPVVVYPSPEQIFHVLFATSGVAAGGAAEIEKIYAPFVSSTMKVGMRVPILYLRTTKGRAQDWEFDPDFDISRRCGDKILAEDSLNGTIRYAVEHQLPVLFTLNGGVWADARCDEPEWDINDALEQDVANCQWNERNEVLPDDFLKNAPGSEAAPELARTLTFNVFASQVRYYKKRNLQQAGRVIALFAKQYPHLFVGVNLDPDLYLNPFVESPKRWYDYNPDTLRQFREWLQGSGVYAGETNGNLPNLSAYRRLKPLALAEVGRLRGQQLSSWDEVDAPRQFPTVANPFWRDPWVKEWEFFRRHLVDLHYDELSLWLGEVGIERKFIFSSQGFMAPKDPIMPFAVRLNSETKNYDSGGMSVEGSIPVNGHLGAILYGSASLNQVRMESGASSLFSTFRMLDPGWGVVEYNTADFSAPNVLPDFAAGYRSLRDIFNYGARFVSPMAWNGSNGLFVGQTGFASFTSVRNSPLEDAIKEFLTSHANLPRGTRLWTFGAANAPDNDGWASIGGEIRFERGFLHVRASAGKHRLALLSPDDLALPAGQSVVLELSGENLTQIEKIQLFARADRGGEWFDLAAAKTFTPSAGAAEREKRVRIAFSLTPEGEIGQLQLAFQLPDGATEFALDHILIRR